LFNACAELGTNESLNLVKTVSTKVRKCFHSNPRLLNSLVNALIKCGDCPSAENLYRKMEKSVIGYGNLMNGYVKENNPSKTLHLFNQMKIDGIEPNLIIYLSVIKALAQIGDYSMSLSIVEQIPKCLLDDIQIQTTLIDMWVNSN
jgi:pentatricopeptide repeat protein